MNQQKWFFVNSKFKRQEVGIAHSATSGHLVILVNGKVSQIDFSVLSDKEYTFFIEEELCKLFIKGNQIKGFSYDFIIDTEANTPLNLKRNLEKQQQEKKDLFKVRFLIIGMVVFLFSCFFFLFFLRDTYLPAKLTTEGVYQRAIVSPSGKLEFIGGSKVVFGFPLAEDKTILDSLNLKKGTEISVLYDRQNASYFIIDWYTVFQLNKDSTKKSNEYVVYEKLQKVVQRNMPYPIEHVNCVFERANLIGGFKCQMELVDAFVLKKKKAMNRWNNDTKYLDILQFCSNGEGRKSK